MQDKGDGGDDGVSQLISREDREELLNRKIEQMKKRNEELLQRHLVCNLLYTLCFKMPTLFHMTVVSTNVDQFL